MAQHDNFLSTIFRESLTERTTTIPQPNFVYFVSFVVEIFLRKEK